jgi:hypothetical protein
MQYFPGINNLEFDAIRACLRRRLNELPRLYWVRPVGCSQLGYDQNPAGTVSRSINKKIFVFHAFPLDFFLNQEYYSIY